ncbi:hypothetical protein VNO78_07524 [Psophocarpus tetragonolobus]|uniref:Uncharacterized protein n=1 Tax=Psophocarpus tetragonolobus TaxID=3891 RepID=A0AAN9T3B6_PSOTE
MHTRLHNNPPNHVLFYPLSHCAAIYGPIFQGPVLVLLSCVLVCLGNNGSPRHKHKQLKGSKNKEQRYKQPCFVSHV